MTKTKQVEDIIKLLSELKGDLSVPKNIRSKIEQTVCILEGNLEVSIKKNKVLNELDEVADDSNLQSYTRTQIWNVVSLLENL